MLHSWCSDHGDRAVPAVSPMTQLGGSEWMSQVRVWGMREAAGSGRWAGGCSVLPAASGGPGSAFVTLGESLCAVGWVGVTGCCSPLLGQFLHFWVLVSAHALEQAGRVC